MKDGGTSIMVRDMHFEQGLSISEITRITKMSRNTVKKYLREEVRPDKRKGSKRGSKLDPYKEQIEAYMAAGIYNSVVIHQRLREQGFDGGLSIVKAYLQQRRPPAIKEQPAVRRYETKPGSQVQMDWGICKYTDLKGRVRKVACFIMVLGFSRMRYIEFSKRCDLRSMLRCIVHAFEYFGGVPQSLLTDHMKTVVLHVDGGKASWQEGFLQFATDLGFIPKLCRVRRPQTKGKVERLVSYVKDNFMPGRQFLDLVDLNLQARSWLTQVNGQVHGTTGEIPFHELCKEGLNPIPVVADSYTWEERKVSWDGFVSYDGVKYGVNWKQSGQYLRVKVERGRILIADQHGELIQEHCEIRSGRRYVYAPNQYEGLQEAQGYARPPAYGQQIESPQVEIRDLSVYDLAAGG